ncbi:MAG: N-acyl homoserine lactonase family protein [Proteobacteria bacterium]|nr:N-acyl homoserine lactonase family protein [Pseudomonadota bacterium]MBI3496908.1 N-acyl homoserine lactonase family protein [Pseudomonadota bacterium]
MKLSAFTLGRLTGKLGDLMQDGEGEVELPIPAYLIRHEKGTVLFDTGMHPDCQHDPAGRAGPRIGQLFKFDYQPGDEVSGRLKSIGQDPAKIDFIVNSHLHFDHVGGNALIPNATVVVQKREWEAGMDPDIAAQRGFNRRDFDLGHKLMKIDGEHDLFGDGRVVCLPTYGHTPGHQSLKVRLEKGEVVLAADACYFCRTLRERRLPPRAHDHAEMMRSLDKLAALEAGGARIFFGHDAEFWASVPQAPAEIAF